MGAKALDTSFLTNATAETIAPIGMPKGKRNVKVNKEKWPFVCWDGEGTDTTNEDGETTQHYSLLGNSSGECIIAPNLSTEDCLAFLVSEGAKHSESLHVAFAFDYDVNMILRDLSFDEFKVLRESEHLNWREYKIEYIPRKWLTVTRESTRIRIEDSWGFFQGSFLSAVDTYLGDSISDYEREVVEKGKAKRGAFTYENIAEVEEYWRAEIGLFERLMYKLRSYLYKVDLRISSWYGPGAIANYAYTKYGIRRHKKETPRDIYRAARYAYAGGRFEVYNIGYFRGPVYGMDINSAYPDAIRLLPSLTEGEWTLNSDPTRLVDFGVYYVHWDARKLDLVKTDGKAEYAREPMPLFRRSRNGSMLYPIETRSWYWAPELEAMLERYPNAIATSALTLIMGWEYTGWHTRPFSFVESVFEQRAEMKRHKDGAEKALKLMLNSLYGKMAQRAGWENNLKRLKGKVPQNQMELAPKWHQLEWAGWVTSYARAKIYRVLSQIPADQILAVETDGIYTTKSPKTILGRDGRPMSNSKKLGEWEIEQYADAVYLSNGVYAKRKNISDELDVKSRGADRGSIPGSDMLEFSKSMHSRVFTDEAWPDFEVSIRRFVGYGIAMTKGPDRFKDWHCNWVQADKSLTFDEGVKRAHVPYMCMTCLLGHDGYERPHQLMVDDMAQRIKGRSYDVIESKMHHIPWLEFLALDDMSDDGTMQRKQDLEIHLIRMDE